MRSRTVTAAFVATALSLCLPVLRAQDRDDHDRQDRRDHDHRQFNDHDRDVLRDWYRDHADRLEPDRGGERWNNEDVERHLQVGSVIESDFRRWSRPVPDELVNRLGPLPRYWRYVLLGYNVCMVDDEWHVRDVYHFDQFNDHDRRVIQDWNRDHPNALKQFLGGLGVRIDNGDLDRRLQVGLVVDPDLRERAHDAPEDLASRLSPPPREWRYVIVGDRLCLVDREWRVHESFHFSGGK